ncbi:type II toxin-antitoxin system HicB family antitoxin [Desulfonema magnum]|uniref:Toxin-antitoxin system HicB domain-containing protein n=1 Tax=Desulfonema magnum TaxID=45655 RepID=A0A975BXI1_9BACT|nr:type II toxin-antitoxin system HicB family antitoxin [Desulfonema magnum]QTA93589.1 Toxin-antitoxin system HicB domain-containing protein [Desulfonema magnum]
MKFKVQLIQSDEGFAISCPSLPGCHSQGKTEQEALENIREAIILWLETFADLQDGASDLKGNIIKEIEIPLGEGVAHA